jgi:hypothetical protein
MTEPESNGTTTLRMMVQNPVQQNRSPIYLCLEYPTDWQLRTDADTVRTLQRAAGLFGGALATLAYKDGHYRGAWKEQGWRGNVARILSKSSRLKAMLWRSDPTEDDLEPVVDTLVDLINLSVFAILNRRGDNEWGRGNGPG